MRRLRRKEFELRALHSLGGWWCERQKLHKNITAIYCSAIVMRDCVNALTYTMAVVRSSGEGRCVFRAASSEPAGNHARQRALHAGAGRHRILLLVRKCGVSLHAEPERHRLSHEQQEHFCRRHHEKFPYGLLALGQ